MSAILRRCTQLRRFCTEVAEEQVKKRYRRKNIAEVASYLPDRGVGVKFTRLLWLRNGYENSYWTITRVEEKNKGRLRYYGKRTWKGVEDPRERPVRTGQKRGWRYILEGDQKTKYGKSKESASIYVNNRALQQRADV